MHSQIIIKPEIRTQKQINMIGSNQQRLVEPT